MHSVIFHYDCLQRIGSSTIPQKEEEKKSWILPRKKEENMRKTLHETRETFQRPRKPLLGRQALGSMREKNQKD